MTIGALLGKLDGLQGRGPAWRAICPAHESRHRTRTLAVRDGGDGRILIHCHAGCAVDAIVGALGMDLADLMPPRADDLDRPPREKRPWSARDVARSLEHEAAIAWLVLIDLRDGRVISAGDRKRAGLAAERCADLMRELAHAT